MKQTIRIIGGHYRGKKLHFPAIPGLRPTADRVKETLFNWLMHDIQNARCLDAFAGSGSLGFEAFSRGASYVVLVEASRQVFANLQQIASDFESKELHVVHADANDYLFKNAQQFDIVFLDPPFVSSYLDPCIHHLAHSKSLIKGGLVYVESPNKLELDATHWLEKKSKKSGQVFYSLYVKL